jgi:hypothetical protein
LPLQLSWELRDWQRRLMTSAAALLHTRPRHGTRPPPIEAVRGACARAGIGIDCGAGRGAGAFGAPTEGLIKSALSDR